MFIQIENKYEMLSSDPTISHPNGIFSICFNLFFFKVSEESQNIRDSFLFFCNHTFRGYTYENCHCQIEKDGRKTIQMSSPVELMWLSQPPDRIWQIEIAKKGRTWKKSESQLSSWKKIQCQSVVAQLTGYIFLP